MGLLIGICLIFISFLFYARLQFAYIILLVSGILTSTTSALIIIFSKDTLKLKLLWLGIILLFVLIQRFSEPMIIDCSYKIYLLQHDGALDRINTLLLSTPGKITITKDTIIDSQNQLSSIQKDNLKKLRKEVNAYIIEKTEGVIYYGLWGMLDVRLAVVYYPKEKTTNNSDRKITKHWYEKQSGG